MTRPYLSATLALVVMVIQHLALLSAALGTASPNEAMPFLRNSDLPQYLSWIELAKEYWLLPSYHNAQPSPPAMFQPIAVFIARCGLPIVWAYYLLQFLFQWFAVHAFFLALDQFCSSPRQKRFAFLFTVSTIPVMLLIYTGAHVLPLNPLFFITGIIDYSYQSADGLFRGGASNSPTLSWGTATLLLGFTLLARYLRSGSRRDLSATGICFFFSALLHPFEIFVLTAAATPILLLVTRDVKAWVILSASGAAGVLPYVIQTLRTPWLMEMSKQARWQPPYYLWPLFVFGIPFVMVIYLLFLRIRLKEPQDLLLLSWFVTGIVLPYIPIFRGAEHFYDGYACCIGMLLARRLAVDPQLKPLYEKYKPRFHYAAAAMAGITILAIAAMSRQIWVDGRNPDPFLISAVRTQNEGQLLAWMKTNLERSLVLSPVTLAPWVAAVPLPSLASHDIMTIGFEEQSKLADRFYKGEDVGAELIHRYPIRYIVVPDGASPKVPSLAKLLATLPGYRIFEIPRVPRLPY